MPHRLGVAGRVYPVSVRPYKENIVTVELLVSGYRSAVDRYTEASRDRDARRAFHALFEALNWAVAVDARIAAHWVPEGTPLGRDWRQRVSGAELLDGLRWARNTVHHDWSDALRPEDGGLRFPMRFPLTFSQWAWRDLDDLPKPGRKDPAGERAYSKHLAGHPAEVALLTLLDVFERILRFLEPATWRRPA